MGKTGPDCSTGLRLLVTGEHGLALRDECVTTAKGSQRADRVQRVALLAQVLRLVLQGGTQCALQALVQVRDLLPAPGQRGVRTMA